MATDNGTTNGVVENMEAQINRVEELVKEKPAKKKSRLTRFARLWSSARKNGTKGKLKGTIQTEEGVVKVTLNSFPESLTDEAYEAEAIANSLNAVFPTGEREMCGIRTKSGNMKLEGAAAAEFLADVMDSAND